MKLDPVLIRKILFAYEALPLAGGEIRIEGYSTDQLIYHQLTLSAAGFLVLVRENADDATFLFPVRLTYAGHEFLALCRNETIWKKALTALEKISPFALGTMQQVLSSLVMDQLRAP